MHAHECAVHMHIRVDCVNRGGGGGRSFKVKVVVLEYWLHKQAYGILVCELGNVLRDATILQPLTL